MGPGGMREALSYKVSMKNRSDTNTMLLPIIRSRYYISSHDEFRKWQIFRSSVEGGLTDLQATHLFSIYRGMHTSNARSESGVAIRVRGRDHWLGEGDGRSNAAT